MLYRLLMRHRSFILVAAFIAVLLVGAVGAYAYDSSREDRIADGVKVAGVDVGGLSASAAQNKLENQVGRSVKRPVVVTGQGKRFTLSAQDSRVHADIGGMVDQAVAESRKGNLVSRVARDLTGGTDNAEIPVQVNYSKPAVQRLVSRANAGIAVKPKDASLSFPSLTGVKERDGVRVDTAALQSRVESTLGEPYGKRSLQAPTRVTKPKVTRDQLAQKYPTVIVINRSGFQLKLYKKLRLVKSYRIAVGMVGLETPAGLYHIQNKGVNVPWNVPNSAWAGSLAGHTIPGGSPDNPIKARWLGIFAGAGIHGTDELGSLGSAASHGCVRMAIPDVINLYPQVPVGTPTYIQ
jgi:lipoprotein-anchoring transpeptidase ErfK/SrfK